MRESGIVLQVVKGSGHSPFGFADPKCKSQDPGFHNGPETHEARFDRDVEGCSGDPVVLDGLGRVSQTLDFRMGCGIVPGNAGIVAPPDHCSVENQYGPNGDLSFLVSEERFRDRLPHPSFVVVFLGACGVRHHEPSPVERMIRPVVFRMSLFLFQWAVMSALVLLPCPNARVASVQADPLVSAGDPPAYAKVMKKSARAILEGHPERAIRDLVTLERAYPDYDMVHFLLGLAYGKTDQNAKSVLEEQKAILLNPKNEPAHVSYGIALGNTGHFRKEIQAEREALSLNPKDEVAWESIGWAYASLGKWSMARASEETAIRFRKEDSSAHMILGVSMTHMGFPEEGLSEEKEAARLDPDDQGVKRAIAWISGILHPVKTRSEDSGHFNPILSPENGTAPPGLPNSLSTPSQSQNPAASGLRAPVVGH